MLMWATVGVTLLSVPWRATVAGRQGGGGIQFCASLTVDRWHRWPVGRPWIGLVPSLAGSCSMAVALPMDRVCRLVYMGPFLPLWTMRWSLGRLAVTFGWFR